MHIPWICSLVVFKPFATFKHGQIVAFNHDQIAFAEGAEDLFVTPYQSLNELVEAQYRESG